MQGKKVAICDPVLGTISDAFLALKKQGVGVERFNLAQQIQDFMANKDVAELPHKNGKNILPITMVNGSVVRTGSYPSYEDLCRALDIEPLRHKPMTLSLH